MIVDEFGLAVALVHTVCILSRTTTSESFVGPLHRMGIVECKIFDRIMDVGQVLAIQAPWQWSTRTGCNNK